MRSIRWSVLVGGLTLAILAVLVLGTTGSRGLLFWAHAIAALSSILLLATAFLLELCALLRRKPHLSLHARPLLPLAAAAVAAAFATGWLVELEAHAVPKMAQVHRVVGIVVLPMVLCAWWTKEQSVAVSTTDIRLDYAIFILVAALGVTTSGLLGIVLTHPSLITASFRTGA